MAIAQHISMRVPWRDEPWNDKVCASPLDNSSCLLLKNIGDKRDDAWGAEVAGTSFAELADPGRLPCLFRARDVHVASRLRVGEGASVPLQQGIEGAPRSHDGVRSRLCLRSCPIPLAERGDG